MQAFTQLFVAPQKYYSRDKKAPAFAPGPEETTN
jgi:hypothetical protein